MKIITSLIFLLSFVFSQKLFANELFEYLDNISERIYAGDGTWGNREFKYKMLLRDSYLRADVYLDLYQSTKNPRFLNRANEVASYLMTVQKKSGTGVFGIPVDINNPEFGKKIRDTIQKCPTCVRNGIIYTFPESRYIPELYYDHGYALYTLSKVYLITKNKKLLHSIIKAAQWTLDKPMTKNINYLSALAKGLAYAYQATNDKTFLEHSLKLTNVNIIPYQGSDGVWKDGHNNLLEYHGFIVSGLISVFQQISPAHKNYNQIKNSLNLAINHMIKRNLSQRSGTLKDTWPGTNLKAWTELQEFRKLTPQEKQAKGRCYHLLGKDLPALKKLKKGYRLRKAIYSYFVAGSY